MPTGKLTQTQTLTGGINTGNHKTLINRDAPDQHPMSAITGLLDALNSDTDKIAAVEEKIDSEANRAIQNEQQLATAIEDTANAAKILVATEKVRAEKAENSIVTDIANVRTEIKAGDAAVTKLIEQETSRAEARETELEEIAKEAKEAAKHIDDIILPLKKAVADETENRIKRDNEIISDFTAENYHTNIRIDNTNKKLADEIDRAISAEQDLREELSEETNARIAADDILEAKLNQEIIDRTQADTELREAVKKDIEPRLVTIESDIVTVKKEIKDLEEAIGEDIKEKVEGLQRDLAAEKLDRETADDALDKKIDDTYEAVGEQVIEIAKRADEEHKKIRKELGELAEYVEEHVKDLRIEDITQTTAERTIYKTDGFLTTQVFDPTVTYYKYTYVADKTKLYGTWRFKKWDTLMGTKDPAYDRLWFYQRTLDLIPAFFFFDNVHYYYYPSVGGNKISRGRFGNAITSSLVTRSKEWGFVMGDNWAEGWSNGYFYDHYINSPGWWRGFDRKFYITDDRPLNKHNADFDEYLYAFAEKLSDNLEPEDSHYILDWIPQIGLTEDEFLRSPNEYYIKETEDNMLSLAMAEMSVAKTYDSSSTYYDLTDFIEPTNIIGTWKLADTIDPSKFAYIPTGWFTTLAKSDWNASGDLETNPTIECFKIRPSADGTKLFYVGWHTTDLHEVAYPSTVSPTADKSTIIYYRDRGFDDTATDRGDNWEESRFCKEVYNTTDGWLDETFKYIGISLPYYHKLSYSSRVEVTKNGSPAYTYAEVSQPAKTAADEFTFEKCKDWDTYITALNIYEQKYNTTWRRYDDTIKYRIYFGANIPSTPAENEFLYENAPAEIKSAIDISQANIEEVFDNYDKVVRVKLGGKIVVRTAAGQKAALTGDEYPMVANNSLHTWLLDNATKISNMRIAEDFYDLNELLKFQQDNFPAFKQIELTAEQFEPDKYYIAKLQTEVEKQTYDVTRITIDSETTKLFSPIGNNLITIADTQVLANNYFPLAPELYIHPEDTKIVTLENESEHTFSNNHPGVYVFNIPNTVQHGYCASVVLYCGPNHKVPLITINNNSKYSVKYIQNGTRIQNLELFENCQYNLIFLCNGVNIEVYIQEINLGD